MNEITLAVIDGRITTTSNQIAENFGKQHAHVLRAIDRLECSAEFRQSNFGLAEYFDEQGKLRKAYRVTKNGFAFLAMGFTGIKAAQFKEAYIAAFDDMAAKLHTPAPVAPPKPVKALPPPPDPVSKNLRSRINRKAHALALRQYESIHAYITQSIEENTACGATEAQCEGYIDQFGGMLGDVALVNSRDILALTRQTVRLLDAAGEALATIHRLEEQFDAELYPRNGPAALPKRLVESVLAAIKAARP